MEETLDKEEFLASNLLGLGFASLSLIGGLLDVLQEKGVITPQETESIIDDALLDLEQTAAANPSMRAALLQSRIALERVLRKA